MVSDNPFLGCMQSFEFLCFKRHLITGFSPSFPVPPPTFTWRVLALNRPEKKKKQRKKLMKDSLNLAAMLRRFAREKEDMRKKQPSTIKPPRGPASANTPSAVQCPPGMFNSHPQSVSAITTGSDLNMADLTADPAVMSLLGGTSDNDMLQDLMGDLDFGLLDSPQPGSPRQQGENGNLAPAGQKAGGLGVAVTGRVQKGLLTPPPLPSGLPGPLIKRIEDLRAVRTQLLITVPG